MYCISDLAQQLDQSHFYSGFYLIHFTSNCFFFSVLKFQWITFTLGFVTITKWEVALKEKDSAGCKRLLLFGYFKTLVKQWLRKTVRKWHRIINNAHQEEASSWPKPASTNLIGGLEYMTDRCEKVPDHFQRLAFPLVDSSSVFVTGKQPLERF